MAGTAGHSSFGPERQHHVRPELTNVQGQLINDPVQFLPVELPVRIVENHWPGYAEDFTCCGKFTLAQVGKLPVTCRASAVRPRLSRRTPDHAGFNSTVAVFS